jgi:hypothetical protein
MGKFQAVDQVEAVDAEGERLPRYALSGVVEGAGFPVVWVCGEEEWEKARAEGREPDGVPWPAEDVSPREPPRTDSQALACT